MANTDPLKIQTATEAMLAAVQNVSATQLPLMAMGELGEYDWGLRPGMDKEHLRASNQGSYTAMVNGLRQMVTGALGTVVASPGLMGAMLEPIDEMEEGLSSLFIETGNAIEEWGQDFAPIHRTRSEEHAVIDPFNGKWWANSAAQFGPTVALVAVSFLTEGLATPALLRGLSLFDKVSKPMRALNKTLIPGSKGYKKFRAGVATVGSRLAEGGMEAYGAFEQMYGGEELQAKIRSGELTDQEAREIAGEEAAKVYWNNWAMAVVDFVQFDTVISGMGKFKPFGKFTGILGQMGSEALEEGWQSAIGAEASTNLRRRLGGKESDSSVLGEFITGLGDREQWRAMVQGALGGAVFAGTAAGMNKIAKRIQSNYRRSALKQASAINNAAEVEYNDAVKEYLHDVFAEGRQEITKMAMQYTQEDSTGKYSDEKKAQAKQTYEDILFYEETQKALANESQAVQTAKLDVALDQRFTAIGKERSTARLEVLKGKAVKEVSSELFDIKVKKAQLAHLKSLKTKNPEIRKEITALEIQIKEELETKKKKYREDNKVKSVRVPSTSVDNTVNQVASELVQQELETVLVNAKADRYNTAEGKKEIEAIAVSSAKDEYVKKETERLETAEASEQDTNLIDKVYEFASVKIISEGYLKEVEALEAPTDTVESKRKYLEELNKIRNKYKITAGSSIIKGSKSEQEYTDFVADLDRKILATKGLIEEISEPPPPTPGTSNAGTNAGAQQVVFEADYLMRVFIKFTNEKTKAWYDSLSHEEVRDGITIEVVDFEEAGTIVDTKNPNVKIRKGIHNIDGKGVQVKVNGKVVGGLQDPNAFLFNGKALNPLEPSHLAQLNPGFVKNGKVTKEGREYQATWKALNGIWQDIYLGKKTKFTTEEVNDLFKIWTKARLQYHDSLPLEARPTFEDTFTEPKYSLSELTDGEIDGVIIVRLESGNPVEYYLRKPDGTVEPIADQEGIKNEKIFKLIDGDPDTGTKGLLADAVDFKNKGNYLILVSDGDKSVKLSTAAPDFSGKDVSGLDYVYDVVERELLALIEEVEKFNNGEIDKVQGGTIIDKGKYSKVPGAHITTIKNDDNGKKLEGSSGIYASLVTSVTDIFEGPKDARTKTGKKRAKLSFKVGRGANKEYLEIAYEIKDGKVRIFPYGTKKASTALSWNSLVTRANFVMDGKGNPYAKSINAPFLKNIKIVGLKEDITPPPAEVVLQLKMNATLSFGLALKPKNIEKVNDDTANKKKPGKKETIKPSLEVLLRSLEKRTVTQKELDGIIKDIKEGPLKYLTAAEKATLISAAKAKMGKGKGATAVTKADIERRRQEDLKYWQYGDRQKRIKEGRETTKKVITNLKKKYPSTTLQGIVIRLLEKIIDFNSYAIINLEGLNLPGNPNKNKIGALAIEEGMAMKQDKINALLKGEEGAVKTFIHELVHAFTKKKTGEYLTEKGGSLPGFKANLTEKERAAIKQLERIFEKVKKAFPNSTQYGLTNLDEFLAEAFSNKSFQADLKEITSEGKTTSLFKDWLDAVRDLLYSGLEIWSKKFNKPTPSKQEVAGILEDIMGWTEDLISEGLITNSVSINEINAKYDAELAALEKTSADIWTDAEEVRLNVLAQSVKTLNESKRVASALGNTFSKEDDAALLAQSTELEELRLKKKKLNPDVKGNDIPFSLGEKPSDNPLDFAQASKEVARMLPDTISVREVDTVLQNMATKGIVFGAFINNVIYLNKQGEFGTEYHEAFHGVFRTLLTDTQIDRYYKRASAKWNRPTAQQIRELRANSPNYANLTDAELSQLWLEEKMANEFQKYALKSKRSLVPEWLRGLFIKIKKWFRGTKANDAELELLFHNIYSGGFARAEAKYNVFTKRGINDPAFSLIIVQDTTPLGEPFDTYLTSEQSNRIINSVTFKIHELQEEYGHTLETAKELAFEAVQKRYDISNWSNELQELKETDPEKAAEIAKSILRIQDGLELLRRDSDNNFYNPNKVMILEEATKRLKVYNAIDLETEAFEDFQEDETTTEGWRKSTAEIGGMKSASQQIRTYFGFTPMFVDEFGFGDSIDITESEKYFQDKYRENPPPRDEAKEKFILTANGQTAFNGIERALADTAKSDMLKKLYYYTQDNANSSAVFERLIIDIRKQLPEKYHKYTIEEIIKLPYTVLSESNWFHRIASQFFKSKIIQETVLFDTKKRNSRVFNANVRDVKQTQFDEWAKNFEAAGLSKSDLTSAFTQLRLLLSDKAAFQNEKDLNTAINKMQGIFASMGINLSKGYIKYSIIAQNLDPDLKTKEPSITREMETNPSDYLAKLIAYHNIYSSTAEPFDLNISAWNKAISKSTTPRGFFEDKDEEGKTDETRGAIGRLKRMAESNAIFDESVASSTFQNGEGKTQFDKLFSSYYIDGIKAWRDTSRRDFLKADSEEKALEELGKAFPKMNTYDLGMLYQCIKHNPLLLGMTTTRDNNGVEINSEVVLNDDLINFTLSNLRAHLTDAIREENIDEKGEVEAFGSVIAPEAVAFKSMSAREKALLPLIMFGNSGQSVNMKTDAAGNKIPFRLVNTGVLAEKSTSYLVELPIHEFFTNGKLTGLGQNWFRQFLLQEYERIQKVQKEIGDDNVDKINDYNTSENDRGLKLFQFANMPEAAQLEAMAKQKDANGKSIPLPGLNEVIQGADITLEVALQNFAEAQLEAYKEYLASGAVKILNKGYISTSIRSMSEIINHSGGALGSDSFWDIAGKLYGMINNKHYYYKTKTPRGNTEISIAAFKEGIQKANLAAKATYGFQYSFKDNKVGGLLSRNWQQVKNSDAIFAIGNIIEKGEAPFKDKRVALKQMVAGGTGYAVEMAIQENKPVYVFDQNKNSWFIWKDSRFVKIDTPILTKNFAGIGTRNINEVGKTAIKAVYQKTKESLSLTTDEVKYTSNLLPSQYVEKTGDSDTVKGDMLGNYFFNDYFNTYGITQLLDGDSAMMYKSPVDVVKRNSGKVASGPNMGEGQSNVAVIASDVHKILEKESERHGVYSANPDGIDSTDGQTFGSVKWYVQKYLKHTGKHSKAVAAIYKKINRGIPISPEEAILLVQLDADMRPRKIVQRDMVNYVKTSLHTLSRELVSETRASTTKINAVYDAYERGEVGIEAVHNLWTALPGKQKLHDLLNQMESKEVELIIFDSASKMATRNVGTFEGGQWKLNPYLLDDSTIREQVKTDNDKRDVTDPTQKIQLLGFEHNNPKFKTTINGNSTTIGKLQAAYDSLLAHRVKDGFERKRADIFKLDSKGNIIEPNYFKLYDQFKKSLETSGSDPWLMELFSVTKNGPVYSWNLPAIEQKFQSMYLAYVSKGTLKHKRSGTKYTLVTDYGYDVIEVNGEPMSTEKYKITRPKKYKTRKLKHRVDNGDGTFHTEAVVSRSILKLLNVNVGSLVNIPANVAKQLGVRIPTQDMHSMVTLKIIDTTPDYYGNMIMLAEEAVFIAGADFDIDALYASAYANTKGLYYGSYLGMDNKSKRLARASTEWLEGQKLANKDAFNKALSKLLADNKKLQIYKDILAKNLANVDHSMEELVYMIIRDDFSIYDGFKLDNAELKKAIRTWTKELEKAALKQVGIIPSVDTDIPEYFESKHGKQAENNYTNYKAGNLNKLKPLSTEETNNHLLDIEYALIHNEPNKEIAGTPANVDPFDELKQELIGLGLIDENTLIGTNSPLDKAVASNSIDIGDKGIGPTALFNVIFQRLVHSGVMINDSVDEAGNRVFPPLLDQYDGFESYTSKSGRINNLISTVLTAMTDNGRLQLAAIFNLNNETLAPGLTMMGMGIPFDTVMLMMKQDVMADISNQMLLKKGAIFTKEERKGLKRKSFDELVLGVIKTLGDQKLPDVPVNKATLLEALKRDKGQTSELSEIEYKGLQLKVLREFAKAKEYSDYIRKGAKILQLVKGTKATWVENEDITRAMEAVFDPGTPPPFNLKPIFNDSKFLTANIETFNQIQEDSLQLFILNSKPAQEMMQDVVDSARLNAFDYHKNRTTLRRHLLAFLQMKAYTNMFRKSNPLSLESLFSGRSHQLLMNLLKSKEFKNNRLLNFIKTDNTSKIEYKRESLKDKTGKGRILYDLIGNTRTQKDPALVTSLMDAYKELYFAPGTIADIALAEKATEFAAILFDHVVIKDNLLLRNNSLVRQIQPFFLKKASEALRAAKDSFATGKNLKEVFGVTSIEELRAEFTEEFLRYTENAFMMSSNKTGAVLANSIKDNPVWLDNKTGIFTVDLFAGRDQIPENGNIIMQSGIFRWAGDLIEFPSVIRMDKNYYKLVEYNTKDDKKFYNKLKPSGTARGIQATYKQVYEIGSKQIMPYAVDIDSWNTLVDDPQTKKKEAAEAREADRLLSGTSEETADSTGKEAEFYESGSTTGAADDNSEFFSSDADTKVDDSEFWRDSLQSRYDKISRRNAVGILNQLKDKFGIGWVEDNTIPGIGQFDPKTNTVKINLSKVRSDTPFHEFAHPFVMMIKRDNPKLYKRLVDEIIKEKQIRDRVLQLYTERYKKAGLNQKQIEEAVTEEAIVTAIGQYSADITKIKRKGLIAAIKRFLNVIFNKIKGVFGNNTVSTNILNPEMTLRDLAELMTSDYKVNLGRSVSSVFNQDLDKEVSFTDNDKTTKFKLSDITIVQQGGDLNATGEHVEFSILAPNDTLGWISVQAGVGKVEITGAALFGKTDPGADNTSLLGRVIHLIGKLINKHIKGKQVTVNSGKGIGSTAYRFLAAELDRQGFDLVSDVLRSTAAEALWSSFERKGEAKLEGGRYKYIATNNPLSLNETSNIVLENTLPVYDQLEDFEQTKYQAQITENTPKVQRAALEKRIERQKHVTFNPALGKNGKYVYAAGTSMEVPMDRVGDVIKEEKGPNGEEGYYDFDGDTNDFIDNRAWGNQLDAVLSGVILEKTDAEIKQDVMTTANNNTEGSAATITEGVIDQTIVIFKQLVSNYPGHIFMTQQIEFNQDVAVAGSTDVNVIRPDGTEFIIDLKSSIHPTSRAYSVTAQDGNEYTNKYDKKFRKSDGTVKASKKERHVVQQSMYKGLALSKGSKFQETDDLFILPLHLTNVAGDVVSDLEAEPLIPLKANRRFVELVHRDSVTGEAIHEHSDYDRFVTKIIKILSEKKAELEKANKNFYYVEQLRDQIDAAERSVAISDFIDDTFTNYYGNENYGGQLKRIQDVIRKIKNGTYTDAGKTIATLMELKDLAELYNPENNSILQELIQFYKENELITNPLYSTLAEPEVDSPIWKLQQIITATEFVQNTYLSQMPELVSEILEPFISEAGSEAADKHKKQLEARRDKYTAAGKTKLASERQRQINKLFTVPTKELIAEELRSGASKDISTLDKLLTPAISSSNTVVATFAKLLKSQFEEARNLARKFGFDADKAFQTYAEATKGRKDSPHSFNKGLYERVTTYNKDGSTDVMAFVSPIDWNKYYKAMKVAGDRIAKLPTEKERKAEWRRWYDTNTQAKIQIKIGDTVLMESAETLRAKAEKNMTEGEYKHWFNSKSRKELTMPKLSEYGSHAFNEIRADSAKTNIYKFLIGAYFEDQARLPERGNDFDRYRLPSMTKSGNDRVREKQLGKHIKYSIEDAFKSTAEDFNDGYKEKDKIIPVLYTQHMPADDVSLDLIASIMRFRLASLRYEAQVKVAPIGEAALALVKKTQPGATDSAGNLVLSLAAKYLPAEAVERYAKKKSGNNIAELLEVFIEMQIYGRTKESLQIDTKIPWIGTVDLAKIADALVKFTSITKIGGNPLLAVANSLQAQVMVAMEGVAGEFFDMKMWRFGKAEYARLEASGQFFTDDWISGIRKTKIGQLIDMYDALQGEFKDKFGRSISKSTAKRFWSLDTWFKLQHKGEHEAQVTALIALLKSTPIGNTNLYDAYVLGANGQLQLKEGLTLSGNTTADGLISNDSMDELHAINKRLHGVYNSFDKAILQRKWYGDLIMLFRKFAAPGYKKRYKSLGLDHELGGLTEGFYNTFFRLLREEHLELLEYLNPLSKKGNDLTPLEKANVKRALFEMGMIGAMGLLVSALNALMDSLDDEDEKWALSYPLYWAMRLKTELKFFGGAGNIIDADGLNIWGAIPIAGSVRETLRMLRTPTIATTVVEQGLRLIYQLGNPGERYKRNTKYYFLGENMGEKGDRKLPVYLLKLLGHSGNTRNPQNAIKFLELTTN